jgi:hypothetical protein
VLTQLAIDHGETLFDVETRPGYRSVYLYLANRIEKILARPWTSPVTATVSSYHQERIVLLEFMCLTLMTTKPGMRKGGTDPVKVYHFPKTARFS